MKAKPFYSLAEMKQAKAIARKDTTDFMLHLICWCLHDEFGFGHDRIEKALFWIFERVTNHLDTDGEVHVSEIHDLLVKECNIDIPYNKERIY